MKIVIQCQLQYKFKHSNNYKHTSKVKCHWHSFDKRTHYIVFCLLITITMIDMSIFIILDYTLFYTYRNFSIRECICLYIIFLSTHTFEIGCLCFQVIWICFRYWAMKHQARINLSIHRKSFKRLYSLTCQHLISFSYKDKKEFPMNGGLA